MIKFKHRDTIKIIYNIMKFHNVQNLCLKIGEAKYDHYNKKK